ncbi:DUF2922 domain-containing protein [Enterococcus diestrammenae]|uniref:DUF2922 domain-containing protein n=1 Tax=Enterococcus diestrammenae TaxID=1155073 RepID=A0ABV0EYA2_9ENTE|nr:DUF2922 domain-containing protein [Enterococcus diestrammenae]KAF1297998.1 hypothetical protein BAU18_08560 [Enterococcus diestrammenae]HIX70422.1 DUF2922 domain-containing protein [Candidatus Enterococcus stercoravium]
MKKLRMTFLNSEGKKHNLDPILAATNLTEPTVRTAMEGLRDLELFEKDDVQLYAEVKGAKYVETIETPLFED